ncbi:hypothetical protein [Leucobacter komagatae]|uniref:hypothetical protein n=1 Tax=Leucobacter komagatae TaxID=55969 RepID=UPI0011529EF5|nr:hypothetical protein [Leucobacter komagatae]
MLPKISLAELRETQDAELERFRELVPYRIIEKDYGITPPRRATSCNIIIDMQPITPDSGVQLAGFWRALTSGDEDLEPLLEKIRAAYEAKPGWSTRGGDLPNDPLTSTMVVVTSPENYQYLVRVDTEPNRENQKEISVRSSSPCVETPEDIDLDAEY